MHTVMHTVATARSTRRTQVVTSGLGDRLRLLAAAALIGCAGLSAGCGGDFSPPSLVETVRVLGVRATPPYLPTSPATTTTIEAKVVGVSPGQPLCHTWGLCVLTTQQNGQFSCLAPELQLNLGTTATVEVRFDQVLQLSLQAKDYLVAQGLGGGGSQPAPNEPPPSQLIKLVFGIGERDAFADGCPKDISAFLAGGCDDRERCVIGSKSLRAFTSGLEQHTNPTLTGMTIGGQESVDGVTLAVPAGDVELVPTWSADSIEPRPADGGPKTESLLMSWFSTAGTYDKQRSFDDVPANGITLSATDEEVSVWVVVRDGRGGVDWLERRIRAE